MDRALDDIVSESHRGGGRSRGPRGGGRRNDRGRVDYPRDGVRKPYRDDDNRNNIDSEWVHDKYDDNSRRGGRDGGRDSGRDRGRDNRRYSPEPAYDSASAKLRVENLHYDLTEEDLDDLFNRIGPVQKLVLTYDRAGRSNGIAYVTYEHVQDAKRAVREFHGANAKGQPISLSQVPSGPAGGRRPFEQNSSSRSLADRITRPARLSRSGSPVRHSDVSRPAPGNVDRYVPGRGRFDRDSRSPAPRRRDGRRPGERRGGERGGRGRGDRERIAKDGRPKKTQEELDAEMDDYWGAKNGDAATESATDAPAAAPATTSKPADDDIDMDIL